MLNPFVGDMLNTYIYILFMLTVDLESLHSGLSMQCESTPQSQILANYTWVTIGPEGLGCSIKHACQLLHHPFLMLTTIPQYLWYYV